MSASPPHSPGIGTVQFALKVQDCTIEMSAQLPEGPVLPAVLLPVLQGLSSSLSELTALRATQAGDTVSCREGCGACCRQAVPITPVEARMLSEWMEHQPEERKAVLHERFCEAAARLEESGIAQGVRDASMASGRDALLALSLKYFALGIPCPFLEAERCTIHEIRPMRCREYLVVSPAEHCSHPETKEIVGINPPVRLSQILGKWSTNGDSQASELILLAMLDEWVSQHPPNEDRAHRSAPEMLQEFLHGFASAAEAAPSDLRNANWAG
jgi:Fe-S-cluster containining protein